MKAVILAAGAATRLRPLTNHIPKCLLKTGGKRILERTLENLIANDIPEIIIVTGYLEEQIRSFTASRFPGLPVRFVHNERYEVTNNIYSLYLAREAVGNSPMLMMDSDILFDQQIIRELILSGYENCLALKRHAVQDEEIKVKADARGKVIEISKEVKPAEAIGESIGIELFGNRMRDALFRTLEQKVIREGEVNRFYEIAFQELINEGFELFFVDITRFFCMEIDTPEDLRIAREMMNNS